MRVSHGLIPVDSPEVRDEYINRRVGLEEAKAVKVELEAQAPVCPLHDKAMKLVRGPNVYFFGCPKHPKCSKKAWLTDAQKARSNSAPYLANVLD